MFAHLFIRECSTSFFYGFHFSHGDVEDDFGMDSFVLHDFWVTESALGVCMLPYILMRIFQYTLMRQNVQYSLVELHLKVLAVGAFWDCITHGKSEKQLFRLAVAAKRRLWFVELRANAGEIVNVDRCLKNPNG